MTINFLYFFHLQYFISFFICYNRINKKKHPIPYPQFYFFVDDSSIHMGLASPSSHNEATEENNTINKDVKEDFTPMDDDETSKGSLHLRGSELLADKIAQTNVHWAIRGECAKSKFHCLWVVCRRNYVSKQKI